MNKALNGKRVAVLGLGVSNVSAISYLLQHDLKELTVFDTRVNPPFVEQLPRGMDLRLGPLDSEKLKHYDLMLVSPGLNINEGAIKEAHEADVEIVGDIELFAHEVGKARVIGITGSNGKSTVTALMGSIALKAGIEARVGANFGNSVFDILDSNVELYILELSSFELETTKSLKLDAAVNLNVSEDHLDRYEGDIMLYAKAKERIFNHCTIPICNRDDKLTYIKGKESAISFGFGNKSYGLVKDKNDYYLCVNGTRILNAKNLIICGVHNYLNALAAMALSDSIGIERKYQIDGLTTFPGLSHRCQKVATINDIAFYNDSKATNVGSAIACIKGLCDDHKEGLILLAGGLGKGQDFSPLKEFMGREVSHMFCFGRDADLLCALDNKRTHKVINLKQAISEAFKIAKKNQAIVLSPACASFDQFSGYEERGRIFISLVNDLN